MDSLILGSATSKPVPRPRSRLRSRLARHPGARIGGVLILLVVAGALLAPWLSRYDPVAIAPQVRLQGPTAAHPLGTDIYGRDTLARVLHGGRISLAVGVLSTINGATALGSTWRPSTRPSPAPITRAASTYSSCRTDSTAARATRESGAV